jgi:hypothetical protein
MWLIILVSCCLLSGWLSRLHFCFVDKEQYLFYVLKIQNNLFVIVFTEVLHVYNIACCSVWV